MKKIVDVLFGWLLYDYYYEGFFAEISEPIETNPIILDGFIKYKWEFVECGYWKWKSNYKLYKFRRLKKYRNLPLPFNRMK